MIVTSTLPSVSRLVPNSLSAIYRVLLSVPVNQYSASVSFIIRLCTVTASDKSNLISAVSPSVCFAGAAALKYSFPLASLITIVALADSVAVPSLLCSSRPLLSNTAEPLSTPYVNVAALLLTDVSFSAADTAAS